MFESLYNERSQFLYLAVQNPDFPYSKVCDCYFIRRQNWQQLVNDFSEDPSYSRIVKDFRHNEINRYKDQIFDPICVYQKQQIEAESRINIKPEDRRLSVGLL